MTDHLRGVRVVDLSRVLAGPLCSMLLGDLGADVIKVERPGAGDETRGWGPPFDERGLSAYFVSTNRNKLSIALDLTSEGDSAVLAHLIAEADVVLDNFAPGSALVDAQEFLQRHERLIWLSMTGFGPGVDRLGYDLVVQAECGWMAITGAADGEPTKVGVALADVIAGKDAALAIVAALAARERSGAAPLPAGARRLRVSLAHSATAALVNVAQNVLVSGADAGRYGNAHPNLVPYEAFAVRDGHVVIAVGNDAQWQRCCDALGLQALGGDASLASNSGRLAQRARVVSAVAAAVASLRQDEVTERLSRARVPCGRVRSVRAALADVPHSPQTGVGPATPGSVRLPPPQLDEHGEAIRREGWGVFAPGAGVLRPRA